MAQILINNAEIIVNYNHKAKKKRMKFLKALRNEKGELKYGIKYKISLN